MALRRRSHGHHHRPDWEQRLCRIDAALADDDLSPAEARERYRAADREHADDPAHGERTEAADVTRPHAGEPSPVP